MRHFSRQRVENMLSLAMNATNIAAYILLFAAAIVKGVHGTLVEIMQSVYAAILCVFLTLHEIKSCSPAYVYFGFLSLHRGKGLVLLCLGCLVTCTTAYNIIVTIFSISIGLAYVILSFYPRSPPPNSLDLHWQQHRDFYRPRQQNTFHATTPQQQKSYPMLERPQPAALRNSRQDMT